jgi:hypothetical protein
MRAILITCDRTLTWQLAFSPTPDLYDQRCRTRRLRLGAQSAAGRPRCGQHGQSRVGRRGFTSKQTHSPPGVWRNQCHRKAAAGSATTANSVNDGIRQVGRLHARQGVSVVIGGGFDRARKQAVTHDVDMMSTGYQAWNWVGQSPVRAARRSASAGHDAAPLIDL